MSRSLIGLYSRVYTSLVETDAFAFRFRPGRFIAVNEMKLLFSHLIDKYDIRAESEGVVPEPTFFGATPVSDTQA